MHKDTRIFLNRTPILDIDGTEITCKEFSRRHKLDWQGVYKMIKQRVPGSDIIKSKASPRRYQQYILQEFYFSILDTVNKLKDKRRQTMYLRYGLGGEDIKTLEATGIILGITRERVRQLEEDAKKEIEYYLSFK